MNKTIRPLLDVAQKVNMTADQQERQRRSFAYGNTAIENDRITREMISDQADQIRADSVHGREKK